MDFHTGRQAAFLLAVWITAAGLPGMAVIGAAAVFFGPLLWIAAVLFSLIIAAAALWYPPRYAAAFAGRFDGWALRVESGVFWRRERIIPADALRTLECCSTPLQHRLRLQTLVLRFAGGTAVLPLLDREEALQLSSLLEKAESEHNHDF